MASDNTFTGKNGNGSGSGNGKGNGGSGHGNGHGPGSNPALRPVYALPDRTATQELNELSPRALLAGYDHQAAHKHAIEEAVRSILVHVGEDPNRDGLLKTPHRVAKAFFELLEGYEQDVATIVNGALFDVEYGDGEMVVVADIPYNSLCEHHMLPFTGRAHVAYLPRKQVVGLSKIPRIVDMFARRLQVQERLTNEVADALQDYLDPVGVMVMVEGQHSCAALRGVKKHGVNMVTTAKRGEFRTNPALREEFFRMVDRQPRSR